MIVLVNVAFYFERRYFQAPQAMEVEPVCVTIRK